MVQSLKYHYNHSLFTYNITLQKIIVIIPFFIPKSYHLYSDRVRFVVFNADQVSFMNCFDRFFFLAYSSGCMLWFWAQNLQDSCRNIPDTLVKSVFDWFINESYQAACEMLTHLINLWYMWTYIFQNDCFFYNDTWSWMFKLRSSLMLSLFYLNSLFLNGKNEGTVTSKVHFISAWI